MSETGNFRSRLFGGFDRQDVINYISRLAADRNDWKAKCERLEAEVAELRARTESAENAAAEEKRRADDYILDERVKAAQELEELCSKYESVRSDMEVTTAHIKGELSRTADGLALLMNVFSQSEERFSELRDILTCEAENGQAEAADTEDDTEIDPENEETEECEEVNEDENDSEDEDEDEDEAE